MQNSLPFLKRKLKNFRTLNQVGDVNLNRSIHALSEVQQQKKSVDEALEKTNEALELSGASYQSQGNRLVPELMGNQYLYVHALMQDKDEKQKEIDSLEKDVQEKLKDVFKMKKTNQVVQQKIDQARSQMCELYFKHMDEEIADVLQNKRED